MVGRVQLVLNKVKYLMIFAVGYVGQPVKKGCFWHKNVFVIWPNVQNLNNGGHPSKWDHDGWAGSSSRWN